LRNTSREEKVEEFRKKAGKGDYSQTPGDIGSVMAGVAEEFTEMAEAIAAYIKDPNEDNRKSLVKEWADVAYVVSQVAVFFDIPGEAAYNRVHANNLTKVAGVIRYREDGKILKPEGYQPCDMTGL
jgi:predicted HAD superfamily Cof-like phosphohydrolase